MGRAALDFNEYIIIISISIIIIIFFQNQVNINVVKPNFWPHVNYYFYTKIKFTQNLTETNTTVHGSLNKLWAAAINLMR